jgi:hypothetical protein
VQLDVRDDVLVVSVTGTPDRPLVLTLEGDLLVRKLAITDATHEIPLASWKKAVVKAANEDR